MPDPNDKISKQLEKVIKGKITGAITKGFSLEYANTLKERIQKRTRLGTGIDPQTGSSKRLKPLADITKKVRRNEARIFSTKGGGKIVWTDGTEDVAKGKGSKKNKQARKESFKAFFGDVNLSSKTTPAKSNLTATGQLIDALTVAKLRISGTVSYLIYLGDRRGRDLFGNSSKIGNRELNKYVSKERPWLGFTRSQVNEIKRDIRQFIVKFIK
jgi:hypothetical protein